MENNNIKSITIVDNELYLRQISMPVNIRDDKNLKQDIDVLGQFFKENEVMAMAAIQLSIPKRLIYLKNTNLDIINRLQTDSITENDQNYNEARVLINPAVINREGLT